MCCVRYVRVQCVCVWLLVVCAYLCDSFVFLCTLSECGRLNCSRAKYLCRTVRRFRVCVVYVLCTCAACMCMVARRLCVFV